MHPQYLIIKLIDRMLTISKDLTFDLRLSLTIEVLWLKGHTRGLMRQWRQKSILLLTCLNLLVKA